MTAVDRMRDALHAAGKLTRQTGPGRMMAQCPAHEDGNPSLSIRESTDGTLLVHCFAGCTTADVLGAVGLRMGDLFSTEYTYDDGRRVQRSYTRDGRKRFAQSGNTKARPSLYRLAQVREAVAAGEVVYLVEGEKDVHALESVGAVATTSPMGAGNVGQADFSPLAGAAVVAVVDRDEPGAKWAAQVARLLPKAELVTARSGKDAADHVAAGLGLDDLEPYQPPTLDRQVMRITAPAIPAQAGAEPVTHRGQVRMAYRLAEAHAGKLLHVHGLGWFAWDGRRWAEDTRGAASRAVLDVLRAALAESLDDGKKDLREDVRRCETAAGVAGVLALAGALEPFAVTVDDLDADPYLLNCCNGTVDLRTLEVYAHNPADRLTKVTGAAFEPQAHGPTWEAFLRRVLPDETVREFLQRYVGQSLAGRVLEHLLAILTGTGRNGKGVLYGAVSRALGDYAITAEPDLFMHREGAHPTGEMDLLGVRFVVVSESDQGRKLAEATVKRLTGGDRVRARRMRQDYVQFQPSHTACLVTNHLPKVSGGDPALWARLRVVPFGVVIPEAEQDPHLPERLEAETEAVLAWAVAGWQSYRNGGMADPDAVKVATNRYRADSDAVARFLDECTLVNPNARAGTGELFERWQRWAVEDGAEQLSKKALGEELERRGFTEGRTGSGRFRKGLFLLADGDDDDA